MIEPLLRPSAGRDCPIQQFFPSDIKIRSEFLIVDRRWAIMKDVLPSRSLKSPSCSSSSVFVSILESCFVLESISLDLPVMLGQRKLTGVALRITYFLALQQLCGNHLSTPFDKLVGSNDFCSFDDFFFGCCQISITNIFHDRPRENKKYPAA